MLGFTPVAEMTRSAASFCPSPGSRDRLAGCRDRRDAGAGEYPDALLSNQEVIALAPGDIKRSLTIARPLNGDLQARARPAPPDDAADESRADLDHAAAPLRRARRSQRILDRQQG